jgi:predicted DNA binding protein
MSVIVEFQVQSSDFELGRILRMEGASTIELERLVPVDESTVPLFWIHKGARESFIRGVREHATVDSVSAVEEFDDRMLFTLDWDARQDHIFAGISRYDGQLMTAQGTPDRWQFEVRFHDHESLSGFTSHCRDEGVAVELCRIYHPTEGDVDPWYGLTDPQREALVLAVESGYYDIPRGCTTKNIASQLGISDQAVTERLRRAIASLTAATLITAE